ncbi:MAG: imidazole glycerol phosphate synthase subunit HisH [Acidimicrobiales bacterium]
MIAVLDYGIGNPRSAEKALQRLGAEAELVADPDRAAEADGMVLPGVGAFGRCAEALRAGGLDRVAAAGIERGVPFLGICVGFQLLFEGSDEDPTTPGLGILAGKVRRLPPGVKHPQMQWNQLVPVTGDDFGGGLLTGVRPRAWVYFVHSFAPERTTDTSSICDYGGPVTASAGRDRVWGTQFHPEKSGAVGLGILDNFVDAVAGRH